MENIQKYGIAIAGIVLSVLFSVVAVRALNSTKLGDGIYNQTAEYFYQGFYAGTNNQFAVDPSGNVSDNGIGEQYIHNPIVSTTTVACIIAPPTATSSFAVSYSITQATTSTTFVGIATTSNPFATSTLTSLLTSSNGSNGARPIRYFGGNNMFVTPTDYIIFYYTGGTTNGNLAQGQGGTCNGRMTSL